MVKVLSDKRFSRKLAAIYNAVLAERRDTEYVVNQPQMDKFIKLVEYFFELSDEMGGEEPKVSVVPPHSYGDVTTRFVVVAINGSENVQKFAEVVSYCSAFGIDVEDGEVLVSCTVPRVFVPNVS